MDDRFRAFAQFNDPDLASKARVRHRVSETALRFFPGTRLQDRFVRELALRQAVSVKELLESFEVHHRVRRRVRQRRVADLCCGHGLTGVLFALAERQVEEVICVDRRRPSTFDRILEAAVAVGPWVADKVRYVEGDAARVALEPGTAVLGVHACGGRTDLCIEVARRLGGPVAVMPCCHHGRGPHAPAALHEHLGTELALDVDRTYRLEAMGLSVDWSFIPRAITPMNRILIGWRPR